MDIPLSQVLDHRENVVEGVAHPVGPVLEPDIHGQALPSRVADRLVHPVPMALGRHAELSTAVAFRPLDQEVHHPPTRIDDPVDGCRPVAVAEDLDPVAYVFLVRPIGDEFGRVAFSLRDPGGSDFDAVDPNLFQEHPRELELLRGRIGHVGGLLPVTEGRVHDGDPVRIGSLPGHWGLRSPPGEGPGGTITRP